MHHLLSSRSIEIEAPVQAVFDYAANLENFPNWFPGALSIQPTDSLGVDEVGKTYSELVALPFGKRTRVRIRVVEVERPLRIATEGDYRLLLPRMEVTVHPIARNRTRIEWKMYSRRTGVVARLLLPVFRNIIGSRSRVALVRLKSILESAHARD